MLNRQCLCGSARFAYRASIAFLCLKERSCRLNRPQTAYKFLSKLSRCPERSTIAANRSSKEYLAEIS